MAFSSIRRRVLASAGLVSAIGAVGHAQAVPPPSIGASPGQARPELPLKHVPTPTTAAITAADLMTRLYIFADDSMQGREAGTPGHVRGTEYITRELKRMGVKPMGENGGYYQVVPVKSVKFERASTKLVVDGAQLTPGTDFRPFPGIEDLPFALAASVASAPIVYGGRLGAADAIKPADARGKIVVFSAPIAPGGRGGPGGPSWRVFDPPEVILGYRGAAALVVAALELVPPQVWGLLDGGEMVLVKPDSNVPMIIATKAAASRLIGGDVDSAAVGTGSKIGSVSFSPSEPDAPARNVVAMVEGSDPKLRSEFVVVSAHSDHVGIQQDQKADHDSLRLADILTRPMGLDTPERPLSPSEQAKFTSMLDSVRKLRPARQDSIANGADDDGSGSMGLLELAEYFQMSPQKPKRSILFVWNVAEEKGLYGSEWFTDHPTVTRDSLVADINIDMIGRGASYDIENGGPKYLQILGSRRLSTEYGNWVEEVNARPEFSFKFDSQFDANGHPQQYYCRSDHWNFARWSIPTVFFSTGSHVDYHIVTDEPQYIDYNHYANVVQFVGALATDVAGRPGRAMIDKPRPDPHGPCKQ